MKYFRTYHLPFSKGSTSDDKMLKSCEHFIKRDIVITAKLDGSNVCLSRNNLFARSHSGPPSHPSFDWLKAFHSQMCNDIPEDIDLYGEYLFAKHSIEYKNLPGYLFLFNIRNSNCWFSWEDVEDYSELLDIPTAPVLFKGQVSSEKSLEELISNLMDGKEFEVNQREGVVVRLDGSFNDPNISVAKAVRANHVTTLDHWAHQEIVKNILK